MPRAWTWTGFDYLTGKPVTLPVKEWRVRIAESHAQKRVGGDLVLFARVIDNEGVESTVIVAEVYDKRRSNDGQ